MANHKTEFAKYVEYIQFNVWPEQERTFLATYREAEKCLAESGICLDHELSRSVQGSVKYLLRVEWSAPSQNRAAAAQRNSWRFVLSMKSFMSNMVDVGEYESVAPRESLVAA